MNKRLKSKCFRHQSHHHQSSLMMTFHHIFINVSDYYDNNNNNNDNDNNITYWLDLRDWADLWSLLAFTLQSYFAVRCNPTYSPNAPFFVLHSPTKSGTTVHSPYNCQDSHYRTPLDRQFVAVAWFIQDLRNRLKGLFHSHIIEVL